MSSLNAFVLQEQFLKLSQLLGCHTDKKEHEVFLIYKEIKKGSVAKSYMTNGLLILVYG
jgi:hypothetical protein